MIDTKFNTAQRKKRHLRVRRRVSGTPERPRLCVYRSVKNIYVQLIDDTAAKTLVYAGSDSPEIKGAKAKKSEVAKAVGKLVAEKAKAAGITMVCFDRGGYKFHGRVRALAEAAREAGLKF